MSDAATRLPALSDPREVLAFLRAGDRLAYSYPEVWHLIQADAEVTHEAACILRSGGYSLEPFGGRLAPLGDSLLPGHPAQTWVWAEERSYVRH
jgi:hypothetical protein